VGLNEATTVTELPRPVEGDHAGHPLGVTDERGEAAVLISA
jgi:hypothetical protein